MRELRLEINLDIPSNVTMDNIVIISNIKAALRERFANVGVKVQAISIVSPKEDKKS